MTHDELLAKINGKGSADFATLKYNPEGQKDIQDVFKALRAVVELHKPDKYKTCIECTRGISPSVAYPCPTIQAIEKELE